MESRGLVPHSPPSCAPLLSMAHEAQAGMAHHGHGPIGSLKRSQNKERTTSLVGMVAQWDVPMRRCAVTCGPWGRRRRCLCLPLPACGVPWHPDPARCTPGRPGEAHGSTSSKPLHVGISQRPPGNKFPEGRLHFLAAHFLMLHFPCSTLLSLTACSVWCGFSYNVGVLGFGVVRRQMLPVGPHIWWRYSGEVCGSCSPADVLKLSQGVKPLLRTRLSYEPPLDPICNPPALSTTTAPFAHG